MNLKIKNFIKVFYYIILYTFAFIGFVFTLVFIAMQLHLTDVKGSIDSRNSFFNDIKSFEDRLDYNKGINFKWKDSEEWQVLKQGLEKDREVIKRVSAETSVSERLLVSIVIPEQLRFFTSNRESFKKYFEPLKILGNYTKFSYGVSGIKMETAKKIEENLKDENSDFYLGKSYENILDYQDITDIDNKRLARFTDSHDHYYSYLYTAIYIKQIIRQWSKYGFDISQRPEVLATLFNIGFNNSVPKENPLVGGSTITIGEEEYTFGGLAYDFYYSNEFLDIFQLGVQ
jgi:hypothetical protein